MSYDLYLSSPTLTIEAFSDYFLGRRGYAEPGWYVNEDTGVYFSFAFRETGEDAFVKSANPRPGGGPRSPRVARSAATFRDERRTPHN